MVAFIPCGNDDGAVTVAPVSMNDRHALWPQVYPRQQSNDRSTIDGVTGDLRTNGYRPQTTAGKARPAERSYSFFLGGRLVPAHLQAELRKLFTNS